MTGTEHHQDTPSMAPITCAFFSAVRKVAGRMRQHRIGKKNLDLRWKRPMKRKCMRYIHICVFGNTLGFLNMNSPSPRCHIWGPPFRCLSGSGMAHFSCFSPSGARWRCPLLPFRPSPPPLFVSRYCSFRIPPPRP